MFASAIVQAVVDKIKDVLGESEALLNSELTTETAEKLGQVLTEAASAGWIEGFRTWLQAHEIYDDTLEINHKLYRFKIDSKKSFLTTGRRSNPHHTQRRSACSFWLP
jgi:hypothetical protein